MKGIRYTVDQIIVKLREAEIHIAQGKTVPEVVRQIGISEATYSNLSNVFQRTLL